MTAFYAPAENILGNFQSEGDAALDHANLAGQNTIIRKLYLYASNDRKHAHGLNTDLSRGPAITSKIRRAAIG